MRRIGETCYIHLCSKSVPLQAWSGPEGSRKLTFPDFMTTAQDDGKVVSLTHRPPLPPRKCSWCSFPLGAGSTPGPWCDGRYFMSMKSSNDTSWDRTSDLPICSTLTPPSRIYMTTDNWTPVYITFFIQNYPETPS